MSIDLNDEILQDFLVEAGEILEELGKQLVDLERNPDDQELLNAIFRGFHTIKGGAGFIDITALVAICHRAEDVFNILRQGEIKATPELMDIILNAHDAVNRMFDQIREGEDPEPADQLLIDALTGYTMGDKGEAEVPAPSDGQECAQQTDAYDIEQVNNNDTDEITDEEFEELLDQLQNKGGHSASSNDTHTPADQKNDNKKDEDSITEDEFEKLLDNLHDGKAPGMVKSAQRDEQGAGYAKSKDAPAAVKPDKTKTENNEHHPQPSAEATVRVDTKRLDDIMNLVGELVLVRNRLATLESSKVDEEMSIAVSNLDLVTSDLQTAVMKTRMQPIKKVFGRFPRVVRDLSRNLNKDINLELQGEETDLDKNLVEALADPLVHLVRNAVDHGIEAPDVRERNGKPRVGTIVLSAEQEGDHILLKIQDDGAGMDADKLRSIAVARGIVDNEAAARLTSRDCYNLVFMPGFSTKEEISDISGRGVGMDVVKTRITQLNGTVYIDSEPGKGSVIEIKVPLTLAIMPTLMVMVGQQIFALPLGSVVEIFHLDLSKTNVVDGQEVVLVRDKAMPIFYLNRWLINALPRQSDDNTFQQGHVVVVNSAGKHVGFVVDRLLGQEEVVIKPLGSLLQGTMGMAGATITGNGKISLILDVPGLMSAHAAGM